jgi:hypothetical protein
MKMLDHSPISDCAGGDSRNVERARPGESFFPGNGHQSGLCVKPLLGASLLFHVNVYFSSRQEEFYVRYMDDFLLLTETRWPLRRAIGQFDTFTDVSGFSLHPNKTQLGRLKEASTGLV